MKVFSVLILTFIASFIYTNANDIQKIERIDHAPKVDNLMKIDSAVNELERNIEEIKKLQEEDKKYYQMELESDQMVIEKQRELVLRLLKRNETNKEFQ